MNIVFRRFGDVGLLPTSSDLEVWTICQAEDLILITDNRNLESPESLEATIRQFNTPASLPVFTIASMDQFRFDPAYVQRVVEALYDFLLRIDDIRGSGRLFLP